LVVIMCVMGLHNQSSPQIGPLLLSCVQWLMHSSAFIFLKSENQAITFFYLNCSVIIAIWSLTLICEPPVMFPKASEATELECCISPLAFLMNCCHSK
jgi:hypothetical protein